MGQLPASCSMAAVAVDSLAFICNALDSLAICLPTSSQISDSSLLRRCKLYLPKSKILRPAERQATAYVGYDADGHTQIYMKCDCSLWQMHMPYKRHPHDGPKVADPNPETTRDAAVVVGFLDPVAHLAEGVIRHVMI